MRNGYTAAVSELDAYPRPYGTYLLLERLGAGGMSEVDLARRAVGEGSFVRFIVIKRIRGSNQIDEQYVRMFQDEARINAELSHENIAQVYDFGREGDEYYMAMEYVPGLDLRAVQIALAKKGKLLPVRIALTVLVGVLRALQYAHTRVDQLGRPMNIVHRDVNPRNVMLSINGEVKLIDFGVAKAADRLEKTEGNTMKGKFAYMAPEQIQGDGQIDGRADVFALGLVLHELLTGRSPFTGLTEVQILHRILSGQIPPLPESIDHPDLALIRRIHARALALKVDERYPSADAMRVDLEVALGPIGGLAPPRWIAELLREANGDGVGDITRRLRAYRDGAGTGPRPIVSAPPLNESSGTLNVASIEVPPGQPAWLAWAAAGVGLSTVLVLGLLLGVGGVGWWMWSQDRAVSVAPVAPPAASVAPDVGAPQGVVPGPEPVARTPAVPKVAPLVPAGTNGVGSTTASVSSGATSTPAVSATVTTENTPDVPTTVPVGTGGDPAHVEVVRPTGEAAATVTQTAATTTAAPPAKAAAGFLNLTSRPLKLDVYVDGAKVGVTPLRLHSVPAGTHEVAVRDAVTGKSDTRTVTVTAGGVLTVPPVILE